MIELHIPAGARKKFRALFIWPLFEFPHRLLIIIVSLIVLALAQSVFLLMLGPFFKSLFTIDKANEFLLADFIPKNIVEWLPWGSDYVIAKETILWMIPVGLLTAVMAKGIATYFYQFNQQALSFHVAKRYRDRLFGALLNRSYEQIQKRSPGEWMSVLMNDVLYLQSRYSEFLSSVIKDSVLIVSALGAMFLIHWQTAFILLIIAPIMFVILGQISKKISHFAEAWQRSLGLMSGFILSLRKRYPFIQAQSAQSFEVNLFDKLNNSYFEAIKKSIFLRSIFAPGLELFGFLGFAGVLILLSEGYFGGDFGPEGLIQFLAALGVLLRPLKSLGEQVARLQETKGALMDGFQLFETLETTAQSKANERPREITQNKNSRVEIEKLEAGYGSDIRFASDNLHLEVGKSIAVVGPSGAGKSTLVRTLVGLLPPITWKANLEPIEFSAQTSFVSQRPFLFRDTLRENLSYGLTEKPSDEDIYSWLDKFGLRVSIESLPFGLDSSVEAIRSNFSGGEVQRLVMVRALLRNKDYLAFDEATSAIDGENEKLITEYLIQLTKSKKIGLIFITHRLEWLSSFDEIWFVENGKIQLKGRHQDLLSHSRYRDFVEHISD